MQIKVNTNYQLKMTVLSHTDEENGGLVKMQYLDFYSISNNPVSVGNRGMLSLSNHIPKLLPHDGL